jgi:hypothetical protein
MKKEELTSEIEKLLKSVNPQTNSHGAHLARQSQIRSWNEISQTINKPKENMNKKQTHDSFLYLLRTKLFQKRNTKYALTFTLIIAAIVTTVVLPLRPWKVDEIPANALNIKSAEDLRPFLAQKAEQLYGISYDDLNAIWDKKISESQIKKIMSSKLSTNEMAYQKSVTNYFKKPSQEGPMMEVLPKIDFKKPLVRESWTSSNGTKYTTKQEGELLSLDIFSQDMHVSYMVSEDGQTTAWKSITSNPENIQLFAPTQQDNPAMFYLRQIVENKSLRERKIIPSWTRYDLIETKQLGDKTTLVFETIQNPRKFDQKKAREFIDSHKKELDYDNPKMPMMNPNPEFAYQLSELQGPGMYFHQKYYVNIYTNGTLNLEKVVRYEENNVLLSEEVYSENKVLNYDKKYFNYDELPKGTKLEVKHDVIVRFPDCGQKEECNIFAINEVVGEPEIEEIK